MRVAAILFGEQPAAQQPDAHGAEVIRSDDTLFRDRFLVERESTALDLKIAVHAALAQGQIDDGAG